MGQTAIRGNNGGVAGSWSLTERVTALAILGSLMLINVALIAWKVAGVPVRALLAFGFMAGLVLIYTDEARRAVRKHQSVLLMTATLAALGIYVSLVNGEGFADVARAVVESHVQMAVTLLVATIAARIAGARASALVIVAAIGVSVFVAMLQFLDVSAAWNLRATLGKIQNLDMSQDGSFIHGRPMGLSYSPIHLSTQLCLAFGVFAAVRAREPGVRDSRDADPQIVGAVVALVFASIVCATRSPILGALLFLALYVSQRRSAWIFLLLAAIGGLFALLGSQLFEMFQAAQPRVMRLDDDSALGRLSLWKYGAMLIRDNPLGYGLGFTPSEHWMPYWHDVYTMQSADDIRTKELHNYPLNMVTMYGVGLLLLLPWLYALLKRAAVHLVYFVPYIAHIMFHNSGPFGNDNLIWFVVGAIAATSSPQKMRSRRTYGMRRTKQAPILS